MVLGKDRVSGLTDVMMLVSFDIEQKRISVMQIPRDTYADYGSKNHKKLNSAASVIGEESLCEFLSSALGVNIDGYLTLELDALRKTVDAIGGVEIYLPERLYYADPSQGLYIDLPAGEQLLDGKKAEMLVRYREGYAQGDIGRIDMQKRFLAALFKKVKSSVTPDSIYTLASSIYPHVRTDVSMPLAAALAVKALGVDTSAVCFVTLPGEAVTGESGASFYVMSKQPTSSVLREYFFADGSVDKKQLFKNSQNEKFAAIYEKDIEYSVVYGNEFE